MTDELYDIAVIGGGVNRASRATSPGAAQGAAARGGRPCARHLLSLDQADPRRPALPRTLRIRAGPRALSERERLWAIAPHIILPLRFVLPHVRGLRPRWLLRLGLFLYDHIGGRKRLPATQSIRLPRHPAGGPPERPAIRPRLRLFGLLGRRRPAGAERARRRTAGAAVPPHPLPGANGNAGDHWSHHHPDGRFAARAVVNAAGPGGARPAGQSRRRTLAAADAAGARQPHRRQKALRPPFAYFFQLPDGRIFFAIPIQDFTLIGTTDADHEGPLTDVRASRKKSPAVRRRKRLFPAGHHPR